MDIHVLDLLTLNLHKERLQNWTNSAARFPNAGLTP
jgi:hypothetical protein